MTMPELVQKPVEIFISYSRKDKRYLEELHKHLKVYERAEQIRVWHDGNLTPGAAWEPEIYEHFTAAQIILLLISSDFFDSEYCWQRELPEALHLFEAGRARIVPIIIRPVDWKHATKLTRFMVLPQDGRPVELWENKDEAYANIVGKLHELLTGIYGVNPRAETSDPWRAGAVDEPRKPQAVVVAVPAQAPVASITLDESPTLPVPQPILDSPTHTSLSVDALKERRTATASTVEFKTSAASKFIIPEVFVCFLHQDRRDKLLSLRRWCLNPNDPLFAGRAAHLVECQTLEEAVTRMRQRSGGTVLLLDGFEPHSPQLDELMHPDERMPTLEVIVNAPEWEPFAGQRPTSSILQPTRRTVTCDENLLEALRKSLLRVRTREVASVRVLKSKTDFVEFFALRYRVWTDLGYLAADKVCPKTPWEVDFTDRTSLPMGLFSKADGKLLAAARLVRGFGDERDLSMVHTIEEILREQNSDILLRNFCNPPGCQHPFDILKGMARFQEYYRDLVRTGVSKAEVSRVIVSPDWQRGGLGEVVVDTLCSLARVHSIDRLFLACHAKHADFYQRCGFQTVPGVTGTQFLTYKVPSIAMQRQLDGSTEQPE
jgi:predicted GNAT family N-acyltransferase